MKTKYFGYEGASASFTENGQVCINTGEGGGNVVVTEDGVSVGGSVRLENKPSTPGEIATPFPIDMLAGPISAPSAIFMPPFMDLLPLLGPTLAATAAIVALGQIAKASKA